MDFLPTTYDAKQKIWSGLKRQPLYNPNSAVGKALFANMKNYPKNVCQISDTDGKVVTNEEALTWSVRIAQYLRKMGLKHDDVVGIVAKNTTYVIPVAIGCLFNCTPFHPINPVLDEKTITHLYDLTKPKVIFCDGEFYAKVYAATKQLKPLIYTLSDHIEGVPKVEDLLQPTKTELFYNPQNLTSDAEQTVAIMCSSGTTGFPKAVCISNWMLLTDNIFNSSEDIVYCASGLDWMSGLFILATSTLHGCTRIITTKPYSAEYFVELVKKYGITQSMLPPRHAAALVACSTATIENLATLRMLMLGGGHISAPTLHAMKKICPNALFCFGYGFTEVGGGVSGNILLFGEAFKEPISVGKLITGVRARIVDEQGVNLGPNEVGEIIVHNGYNWNGYYGNPKQTQQMQDGQGWFHSGDMGYFDDKHYLYIVDRKKDILKYQGMHYWPAEIEEVIAKLPEVADVCVVTIYDERNGDAAGALVVKAVPTLKADVIKEHVAKSLPVFYKQLHAGVQFVEKIPQNNNGKTDRKEAKVLFAKLSN